MADPVRPNTRAVAYLRARMGQRDGAIIKTTVGQIIQDPTGAQRLRLDFVPVAFGGWLDIDWIDGARK